MVECGFHVHPYQLIQWNIRIKVLWGQNKFSLFVLCREVVLFERFKIHIRNYTGNVSCVLCREVLYCAHYWRLHCTHFKMAAGCSPYVLQLQFGSPSPLDSFAVTESSIAVCSCTIDTILHSIVNLWLYL